MILNNSDFIHVKTASEKRIFFYVFEVQYFGKLLIKIYLTNG